jgi:outer membrane PBP1 activator LpoA protein
MRKRGVAWSVRRTPYSPYQEEENYLFVCLFVLFKTHKQASSSAQVSALTENLTIAQQETGKLMEALNALHKREEDAALTLAENKMAIHRELEAKEEQIRSLRDSLTQITHDKEALQERGKL